MGILPVCMCVYMCVQCPWRPEENIGSSGTRVTDSDNVWVMGIKPRAFGKKFWASNSEESWNGCLFAHSPQRNVSRFMNLLFSYVVHGGQITT